MTYRELEAALKHARENYPAQMSDETAIIYGASEGEVVALDSTQTYRKGIPVYILRLRIKPTSSKRCPMCDGTGKGKTRFGQYRDDVKCASCRGSGLRAEAVRCP